MIFIVYYPYSSSIYPCQLHLARILQPYSIAIPHLCPEPVTRQNMSESGNEPSDTADGRPDGGLPRAMTAHISDIGRRYLWMLQACGFILLVAGLATIVALSMRSGEADAWVTHTFETRRASGELFTILQDAEASVRAHLLISEPTLLTNYDAARTGLPAAQARLRRLVRDNPTQIARLDAVDPLIERRMGVLTAAVDLDRSGDKQALAGRLRAREGAGLMQQIRTRLAEFDQAEADLLTQRERIARGARKQLLLGSSGALSLALVLGSFTTVLSRRQTRSLHGA